jgi:Ser/Thr protein kinase RdoA (MazF antagonist)
MGIEGCSWLTRSTVFTPERPIPSARLLEHLRLRYGLKWTGAPVDLGGSSSLNLLLRDTRRNAVVRVHRAWLEPARLTSIQAVRSALREAELPFAQTIPALDGSLWTPLGEHLVEVERYVEGEEMNSWPRLLTGMRMLGRVHGTLAGIPAGPELRISPTANQIEASEALPFARRAASVIGSWALSADDTAAADRTVTLAEDLETAWRPFVGLLPRQLVHGDFWDNNVLFDADRIVLILDLDFMAERERIDDIALVLYYANSGSSLPRAANPGERQRRLRQLVDAYDSGLSVHLTAVERAAIPLSMARIVLSYTRHMLQRPQELEQRDVLASWSVDLDWSLDILRDLGRWQEALG